MCRVQGWLLFADNERYLHEMIDLCAGETDALKPSTCALQERVVYLERQLAAAQAALAVSEVDAAVWRDKYHLLKARTLNIANIRDAGDVEYYTGLPNYGMFKSLFDYFQSQIVTNKKGPVPVLELEEEFFMVLVRLRTGMPMRELERNFGVSMATASRIFSKWILFLQRSLKKITRFPTLAKVQRSLPSHFRQFPDTRVVIDCTEIRLQVPSALEAQRLTFSGYKHANTIKVLVGATPDCYISFVSKAWGGSASDREIVLNSGLLDLLEPGDAIMMDKGFTIRDLLPPGVKQYMPPFHHAKEGQMSADDVEATRQISRARVHIERVIRRIKEFQILNNEYPVNMIDIVDAVFQTCAFLSNFKNPLV